MFSATIKWTWDLITPRWFRTRKEIGHYVFMKAHFGFKYLNDQQNILWTHIYRRSVANEITFIKLSVTRELQTLHQLLSIQ